MTDTLTRTRVTRDDYLRLPEGPPYFELIDGELIEMTHPKRRHYRIFTLMLKRCDDFATTHGGEWAPEPNLYLPTTEDVYHPDLVYVRAENLRICQDDGIWGVPDVICEILSPSTERIDRIRKMREFAAAGVPHVWLISPVQPVAIEEYSLRGDDYARINALEAPALWQPAAFSGLEFALAEFDAAVAPAGGSSQ